MAISVDFSRTPTQKEHIKLEARLQRLERPGLSERVDRVYESMGGELPSTGLLIRSGLSFRDQGIDADASDRGAPPRELRPPATRLMSSRGGALRFPVTLLALSQVQRKPGAKAKVVELGFEVGSTPPTRRSTRSSSASTFPRPCRPPLRSLLTERPGHVDKLSAFHMVVK